MDLTTSAGFKRLLLIALPLAALTSAGLLVWGVDPVLVVLGLVIAMLALAIVIAEMALVRISRLTRRLTVLHEQTDKDFRQLRVHLAKVLADTSATEFRQIESLLALGQVLDLSRPLPATRSWAASPDLLVVLEREVFRGKPRLVVECGGGVSSIVIAHGLRAHGGRLVVLEHDAQFAEVTRSNLAEQGLADIVDVRHAPLTRVEGLTLEGHGFHWYDPAAIADLRDIDLLVVDGPPESTGELARYPALPLLWPSLSERAVIVMDDTIREAEQRISAAWQGEHAELRVEALRLEKGCHILRR